MLNFSLICCHDIIKQIMEINYLQKFLAAEGFIRGRSYNIRVDDQVLLKFCPKNSDSTYYFSDMVNFSSIMISFSSLINLLFCSLFLTSLMRERKNREYAKKGSICFKFERTNRQSHSSVKVNYFSLCQI